MKQRRARRKSEATYKQDGLAHRVTYAEACEWLKQVEHALPCDYHGAALATGWGADTMRRMNYMAGYHILEVRGSAFHLGEMAPQNCLRDRQE